MKLLRVVAVLVVGLVVGSCQTITEDMPAAAYLPSSAPVPIVVIQLPQPQPQSSLPLPLPAPSNGGGGGGGGGGSAQPTAAPSQPDNGCWRNNCNAVASIHAHVYYIQCHGQAVDGYRYSTEGPWDCDVVLDATPKDAAGRATQHQGSPEWNISGGYSVANINSFTPKILGGRAGEVTFSVRVDGVTSNVTTYRFR